MLYLENRIPKIEKYPMEAAEKAVASIKDKTSEAVIGKMTETKSKKEMAAKAAA